MGLQFESGGKRSPQKMVTIVQTPDYIPTINTTALLQNSSSVGKKEDSAKRWGRVKNVADIWSEYTNNDSESIKSDETPPKKRYGVDDIRKVARFFMRSKKAAKRVRAKYRENAIKAFQSKRSTSFMDLGELGNSEDSEMLSNYNIEEMYSRLKKQKHIKLAVLQQKFINELPVLREVSIKEHLARKIQALERIKSSGYVLDAIQGMELVLPEFEMADSPRDAGVSRRQSMLRRSVDLSSTAGTFARLRLSQSDQDPSVDKDLPKVPLTVADVDRELAMSKSRERIENELHLPGDRLARFAVLKANVNKINGKFIKMTRGKKLDNDKKGSDKSEEDKPYYAPSRFIQVGMVSTLSNQSIWVLFKYKCTRNTFAVKIDLKRPFCYFQSSSLKA